MAGPTSKWVGGPIGGQQFGEGPWEVGWQAPLPIGVERGGLGEELAGVRGCRLIGMVGADWGGASCGEGL